MIRYLIGALIVLGVFGLLKKALTTYQTIEKRQSISEPASPQPAAPAASANLSGLPPSLEAALQAAQKQGAHGLRDFLNKYRFSIQDPRLAAIELDYVVLVSLQDPAEAKRVFKAVQQRTPTWSPLYTRIKGLEKNYR
ncbi:MAG: hypothetical protein HYY23_10040 [Verrucomicrobia bacterium]|nr:hypothetical protein [Verrucomicrobiota bacterium]